MTEFTNNLTNDLTNNPTNEPNSVKHAGRPKGAIDTYPRKKRVPRLEFPEIVSLEDCLRAQNLAIAARDTTLANSIQRMGTQMLSAKELALREKEVAMNDNSEQMKRMQSERAGLLAQNAELTEQNQMLKSEKDRLQQKTESIPPAPPSPLVKEVVTLQKFIGFLAEYLAARIDRSEQEQLSIRALEYGSVADILLEVFQLNVYEFRRWNGYPESEFLKFAQAKESDDRTDLVRFSRAKLKVMGIEMPEETNPNAPPDVPTLSPHPEPIVPRETTAEFIRRMDAPPPEVSAQEECDRIVERDRELRKRFRYMEDK